VTRVVFCNKTILLFECKGVDFFDLRSIWNCVSRAISWWSMFYCLYKMKLIMKKFKSSLSI